MNDQKRVCFEIDQAQCDLLDGLSERFQVGRSELLRWAVEQFSDLMKPLIDTDTDLAAFSASVRPIPRSKPLTCQALENVAKFIKGLEEGHYYAPKNYRVRTAEIERVADDGTTELRGVVRRDADGDLLFYAIATAKEAAS